MKTTSEFKFPCPHCGKETPVTMTAEGGVPREMVADVAITSAGFTMDVGSVADLSEQPEINLKPGAVMGRDNVHKGTIKRLKQ
jgi:hypothetical protein